MGDEGMMGMENLGDIGMEVEGYRLLGWKGFLEANSLAACFCRCFGTVMGSNDA